MSKRLRVNAGKESVPPIIPKKSGKRLALDLLYEESPSHLLKGYSNEQLRELHEKIKDLESEVVKSLDYDNEVQDLIGAKIEEQKLWFYVKWEGGEKSFIPAHVLNRIAPDKVIVYYENILEFRQAPTKDNEEGKTIRYRPNREEEKAADNEKEKTEEFKPDETYSSKELSNMADSKERELSERDKLRTRSQHSSNYNQKYGINKTTDIKVENQNEEKNSDKNQDKRWSAPLKDGFQTRNCTHCDVLLQFRPGVGTKAIRCPVCQTIMPIESL